MARLTLTATVDSSRTGESVEISRAGFAIGRAETNELTLADGQVSRRHAWIVKRDEQWVLHDGGGTAGT